MNQDNWSADKYIDGSYYQFAQAIRILEKYSFNKASRILDIGCGNGRLSEKLAQLVPEGDVLAQDASESMINYARAQYGKIKNLAFKLQSADSIDYENTFDYVFSAFCLHWIKEPKNVFIRLRKALKPNGHVLFILPHLNCPLMICYDSIAKSEKWRDIMKNFNPPVKFPEDLGYKNLMLQAGFENIDVTSYLDPVIFPNENYFYQLILGLPMFDNFLSKQQSDELKVDMTELFKKRYETQNGQYNYAAYVRVIKAKKGARNNSKIELQQDEIIES